MNRIANPIANTYMYSVYNVNFKCRRRSAIIGLSTRQEAPVALAYVWVNLSDFMELQAVLAVQDVW
jgi:hypothetical protein